MSFLPLVHHDIRLDVLSPGSQAAVYVKTNEQVSREVWVDLYQGSEPFDLDDKVVAMAAKKGADIYGFTSTTVQSNLIRAYVPDAVCETAGTYTCELHVYGGGGDLLFSPKFTIYVRDNMVSPAEIDAATPAQDLSAISAALTALAKWDSPSASAVSGVSPDVEVDTAGENVAFTFTLPKGDKGDTGAAGADGAPGADGISPTITSTSITGGHRLTIVDAGGTHTVDVMDGQDGADGADGSPGAPGAAAGFGTPTATAEGLDAGEDPTVSVTASGPDTAKVFAFEFGIPKGDKGDTGSTGPTGNGIASIAKTGTVGKVDTYTITYTNGTTSTFTVTNGEDGHGAGDMLKSVYDTNDNGIVDKATADAAGNVITATYATQSSVPSATTTTPKMDGTAAVGTDTTWAKGDHIHPTDTSRQEKITASGILKGDGNGGVSAAEAGTDYIATNPVYIINATLSAGLFDNPTVTLDKTYAEMKAAFDSGKELLLIATYSGNAFVFRAVYVDTYIQFTQHGKTSSFSIEVDSADAVTTYAGRHQEQITASGMLKGDGNGGVSAAAAGTDYQAPLTAGTDYQEPLTAGTDYVKPLTSTAKTTFPTASGGITTLEDNQRYAWSFGSSSRVLKGPDGATKRCGGTMNVTNTSSNGPTFTTGEIVAGEQPPFAQGLYVWECDHHVWRFTKATQY